MTREVILERSDGIALIRLDAPARRNALTVSMARDLIAVCDEVDADPSIGAVVITSSSSYFCAGGDRATLQDAGEGPADPDRFDSMGVIYRSFKRVGELQVPTLAAVRGGAIGAGTNLMMATDLRIIADDAIVSSGFLAINLHQGGGHGALLQRSGSREVASAMALFGQALDGAAAVRAGLAWESVPSDLVEGRSLELAAAPARDPELARAVTRSHKLQAPVTDTDWNRGLELERAPQMWSMRRKELRASE